MSKKNLIQKFVIKIKRNNQDLGCRDIASIVKKKFGFSVSKSTISSILSCEGLQSPVGRPVKERRFHYAVRQEGAGFFFVLGMIRLSDLARRIAGRIQDVSQKTPFFPLEKITEAILLAKVMYGVAVEKITYYKKSELWHMLGYKVSNSGLSYVLQSIHNNIDRIKDAGINEDFYSKNRLLGWRLIFSNGSDFLVDALLRKIYSNGGIPEGNLSISYYIAEYCANLFASKSRPWICTLGKEENLEQDKQRSILCSFFSALSDSSLTLSLEQVQQMKGDLDSNKLNIQSGIKFGCVMQNKTIQNLVDFKYIVSINDANLQSDNTFIICGKKITVKSVLREYCITSCESVIYTSIDMTVCSDIGQAEPVILFVNEKVDSKNIDYWIRQFFLQYPYGVFKKNNCTLLKDSDFHVTDAGNMTQTYDAYNDMASVDAYFSILSYQLQRATKNTFFPQAASNLGEYKFRENFLKVPGYVFRGKEPFFCCRMETNEINAYERDLLLMAVDRFNAFPIYTMDARKMFIEIA